MKEIYDILDSLDDDQYETFERIKKHKSRPKSNSGRGKKKHPKFNDIFDYELNEEYNCPPIENRISNPFKISEKSHYYYTIKNIIELANDYPHLSSQLAKSPFLEKNPNGEQILIETEIFDPTKYSEFAITSNNKYIITINSDNIDKLITLSATPQKASEHDKQKRSLLRDIAHEYTHALQQSLEYEYDKKNGTSSDNMTNLEKFYHKVLIEADAFTKEIYLLTPPGNEICPTDMDKMFQKKLTYISNRYLNTSYTEDFQYSSMLLQLHFDKNAFHKRMEHILQSATTTTKGSLPQYNIDWDEIDFIIDKAITYNAMTEVIEACRKDHKKIKDLFCNIERTEENITLLTSLVEDLYDKSTNKKYYEPDSYLLIKSVIDLHKAQLAIKQKMYQQDLQRKGESSISLKKATLLLNNSKIR